MSPPTDEIDSGATAVQQVAVAVVQHAGRFVVGLRSPHVALAELAEFPGGRIEPGESAEQAAVRECREETGMEVAVVGNYGDVLHEYPADVFTDRSAFTVAIRFVACRPVESRQSLRSPFRWVAAKELSQLEFPAANTDLIRRLSDGGRMEHGDSAGDCR